MKTRKREDAGCWNRQSNQREPGGPPAKRRPWLKRRLAPWGLGLLLLLLAALDSPAATTTQEQARLAVKSWIAADAAPLGASLGTQILKTETINGTDGSPEYFVVYLTSNGTAISGFVIVSGDDLAEPIVAFSKGDHYDRGTNTPLGALVSGDLPARVAAVRTANKAKGEFVSRTAHAKGKWDALLKSSSLDARPSSLDTYLQGVSDVRVAPLTASLWDQLGLNNEGCYNYYTPPYAAGAAQNYPSGCVATALAQLLRYYKYPTSAVGTPSFSITIGGWAATRSLRGGDGGGGAYRWDDMILQPTSAVTEAQRQAIGALMYDAGLSVNMQYNSLANGGSGTDTLLAKNALVRVFQYSNAVAGYNNAADIGTGLPGMANPNLDAGLPVLLGIRGGPGGHAVVCDGYGYNLNTLYHHLNMGWSGNSNVWYALPVIDSSAGTFTSVYKCIYNVFQTGTGEILSGRIIDSNNQPVAGATVSAALPDGSQFTATSNSRGIYSMAKIPSSTSLTVQATKADYTSATRTVTTGKSSDYAAQSGNAWGVDLTLAAKLSYPITLSVYPSSGGVIAGSGTFSEGASTQISATANPGWIFAGWNDGNTQNPRPITVPSGGATYTANFAVASSFSLSTPGSGVAAFPAAFSWSYQGGAPGLQMFISNTPNFANYFAQSFSATGTNAYFVIGADEWRRILGITGSSSTYYWTLGIVDGGGNALAFADWSAFTPQIPTVAKMLAPSDGSAFSSNVVTFTWNAALEASQYALWVGSEPDTYDLYAGWEGTGLSRTLTLPSDGRTLHVKLWSCVGGEWKSSNSTYTSYSAPGFAMPAMTAPLAGSVLPSSTVTFQWSAGSSATQFSLWAGSTPGSYNLYAGWEGANKSKTLSLPDNGSPIYIRLWALINGTYLYEDYAYTAHGGSGITKAAMTSPANGTTLASPSVTFAWTASPSASQYALWVGSSPGTYDLHASWAGSGTTKTLTFPADGRALYVRLWSVINGTAYYNDYTYTASDQRAKLLSPAAGSALTSSPTTFTWDAGSGATQYKLWIGNAPGNNDVYASAASATPFATAVLPVDGRPLYVRLWSSINGTWFFNSYTFTARDACAQMLQPAPGAALPASTATFTWGGGSGASQYALWVGSEPHTYNLNASWEGSNTSKTLSLPADGSPLYITLWSQINGVFYSKEFTYWAFDNKARMLAPATGSTLASPTVTFAWDAGKGVQGYALWVGSAPDAADLFSANMGSALSQTLTLPADGRSLYVKLWSFVDGVWKANSYSYVAPGTGNP